MFWPLISAQLAVGIVSFAVPLSGQTRFQWVSWESEEALNTGWASAPEGGTPNKTKSPDNWTMKLAVMGKFPPFETKAFMR